MLEFHVFLDPNPPDSGAPETALARCYAALVALRARLAPRLCQAAWHHEPFALWLWDPKMREDVRRGSAHEGGHSLPAHIWGRIDVGESMDDEWFIVGLLLQLTVEQRDLSISVMDEDGELLLIEAAYSIPPWLTPERAANRIFLRQGGMHIIPRGSSRQTKEGVSVGKSAELSLATALEALRTGAFGATLAVAATEAIRARTAPLMGVDGSSRGPPCHGARALLPPRIARLLVAQPSLAAAAATAFGERDAKEMQAVSKTALCPPKADGFVEAHIVLSRCTYAKLMAASFPAPESLGFRRYATPASKVQGVDARCAHIRGYRAVASPATQAQ